MRLFTISILLWGALGNHAARAEARVPVGESAHYQLDRARARSSILLRSGTMDLSIDSFDSETGEQGAFRGRVAYAVTVRLIGSRSGSEGFELPFEFLQPDFIEHLRTVKDISINDDFKVRHLGQFDVTNKDGGHYQRCDKVKIYDIAAVNHIQRFLLPLLAAQKGNRLDPGDDIQDVEVILHLSTEVPGVGAAKIDVSGRARGLALKAGFDYTR